MIPRPPRSTLFPLHDALPIWQEPPSPPRPADGEGRVGAADGDAEPDDDAVGAELRRVASLHRGGEPRAQDPADRAARRDRKSTRLNSSHSQISYAVFCLKKKN